MKARLNLHESYRNSPLSDDIKNEFNNIASELSDKSITVVRNDGLVPLQLEPGDKVLTVTIKYDKTGTIPSTSNEMTLHH